MLNHKVNLFLISNDPQLRFESWPIRPDAWHEQGARPLYIPARNLASFSVALCQDLTGRNLARTTGRVAAGRAKITVAEDHY